MSLQGRCIGVVLGLPLYFAVMILVHEFGHLAGIVYATDATPRVVVWPGYEMYPDPGKVLVEWPDKSPAFTEVGFRRVYGTFEEFNAEREKFARSANFVMLMGSATTLFLAFLSLSALSLLKPKGLARWLLGAGALMHLDMLTYTVLPVFFNSAHLYFVGGDRPEPVVALAGLGLPQGFAVIAILLLSVLLFVWLYFALRAKAPQRIEGGFAPA